MSNKPLTSTAQVLPDNAGRIGPLSYLIPPNMTLHPGDEVEIPFGTTTKTGTILGPSPTPQKATKEIHKRLHTRTTPQDLQLANLITRYHFAHPPTVIRRLAPTTGRHHPPFKPTQPKPTNNPIPINGPTSNHRLIIRAPLIDPTHLAAQEATRLHNQQPNNQILIICPTTQHITQTLKHLPTGAYRIDTKAKPGTWQTLTNGTLPIAIGTRTATLYNAPNLAGIIVVEEDHPGHNEAAQPYTNARDLALTRAKQRKIPITLITANPTPAALGANLTTNTAGTRQHWPTIHIIDRANIDPITRTLPTQLQTAIAKANKNKQKPLLIAPRQTSTRRCTTCNTPRPCEHCSKPTYCTHHKPTTCPNCNNTTPTHITGWDPDRLHELINNPNKQNNAPHRVKITTPTDLPKNKHAGTVIIYDIDAALNTPELIPETHATTLITHAAQAAGKNANLYILTDQPNHPLLTNLAGPRNPHTNTQRTLNAAKEMQLPPYSRLITIKSGRKTPPDLTNWPGTITGPTYKNNNWEALIRIPTKDLLTLTPHIKKLRRSGKIRITVQ